ncbi:MAG: hypothetical protein ACREEM_09710 [Blastocatellia bacterium]
MKMRNTEKDNSDLRLMELAARNPSLGGRDLLLEIIWRGPAPEENERPNLRDVRIALRASSLYDPDHRTRIEHADWLGRESRAMRDLYERGAEIKGDVLMIPAEEHELNDGRETPFITTLSYAQNRIGNIEQAREFHALALAISSETADAQMRIAVFKHYHDRIARDENGNTYGRDRVAARTGSLKHTLEEMRILAGEMAKFETRESIESTDAIDSREVEEASIRMNVTARKVNLRDELLRFPAWIDYETKERLVSLTIPEIDRRLESGVRREAISEAIDNTIFRSDSNEFADRKLEERAGIAGFLKGYIDQRLRDPETRALNTSAAFREARAAIVSATTPEELGRAASAILRTNEQRSGELRRHRANSNEYPPPKSSPLNARERNLLFNGRAPEHHTREMRELRLNYGLSRKERSQRMTDLREGRIEPSDALKKILEELESRRTVKAVAHFQASVLNETMKKIGAVNLYRLQQQLPPHERTFLFERSEERKRAFAQPDRGKIEKEEGARTARGFGEPPRESRSFQEYLAAMGRIERQLLNETIARQNPHSDRGVRNLSITESRNLLPQQTRDEIRLRARNLAWDHLVPAEVFDRNPPPEAMRIGETISHIHEHLQDRARIAQTARNDFVAEKIRHAEERTGNERVTFQAGQEEHGRFVQAVLATLSPDDGRRLSELERYAAHTCEDIYRGFELLDTQLRDLERTRTSTIAQIREFEVLPAADVVPTERFVWTRENGSAAVPIPRLDSDDGQRRVAMRNDRSDESRLTNHRSAPVSADQQWHFDSLREILNHPSNGFHNETRGHEDLAQSFDGAYFDSAHER